MDKPTGITIRPAIISDLKAISQFVDYWLSGRGEKAKAKGAVNDCFISPSQHERYIVKYHTWLMEKSSAIIGWAVMNQRDELIHLLLAGNERGKGYGKIFLEHIKPIMVRAKTNQSTGDPTEFYEKSGYRVISRIPSQPNLSAKSKAKGRPKIINILVR